MASLLDQLHGVTNSAPSRKSRSGRTKGIFMNWADGPNRIRVIGPFLQVHTHFIAPAQSRGDRGICRDEAFRGDNKIPQVITCLNWDVGNEKADPTGQCPICMLSSMADMILDEGVTGDERKKWDKFEYSCRPRQVLKWLAFSRDDPNVMTEIDGVEKEVLGIKIATFTTSAIKDIEGVTRQVGVDMSDPDDGFDIIMEKSIENNRTSYSVSAVINKGVVAISPLTDEERELWKNAPDLKRLTGQKVDRELLVDALHEDYGQFLAKYEAHLVSAAKGAEEGAEEEKSDEKPAEEKAAKKPAADKSDDPIPAGIGDDDDVFGGSNSK